MRIILSLLFVFGLSLQTLAAYTFQPGDVISFSVWDDSKMDRQLLIAPDGRISIPIIGQVKASGRTATQLEEILSVRLKPNYKSKPIVSIALIRVKPDEPDLPKQAEEEDLPQIFVTGEVRRAGGFNLNKPTTVLGAIALAGGLDIYAAKRRIKIIRRKRAEEVVIPFDYLAVTSGRDPWSNILLRDGDVIVVPERGLLKGLF